MSDTNEGLWFEEFEVGQTFGTGTATLDEAEILRFAETYDPQPFHADKAAAEASPYGGLIASGFQTLALAFRLLVDTGTLARSDGGPAMDEIRYHRAVYPGDTLTTVATVKALKPMSRPGRGVLIMNYACRNHNGEDVVTFDMVHFIRCRPDASGVE